MIIAIGSLLVIAIVVTFDELERRRRARGELEHYRDEKDGDP